MEELFLYLVNMSLSASPLILLVVLVRWLMKQTPRWIICLLWAVVGLRLLCPFSLESPIGLMPDKPPVTQSQVNTVLPRVVIPEEGLPEVALPEEGIQLTVAAPTETAVKQITFTEIASGIWAIGAAGMLLYLLVSFLRMRYMVREAIALYPGVWVCDDVRIPFILGVIAPRIYLPSGISKKDMVFVIAHETAHLKRKDHCWKPLGFLILSLFWFNPLIWVGYLMMSKDIELACDEKVVHNLGMEGKKAYSSALLTCCSTGRLVFACPVAFGEVAVRDRIRNILKYKKPAFWTVAVSLAVILIGTVCVMTTPLQQEAVWETVDAVLAEEENNEPPMQAETAYLAGTDEEWAEHPDGIRIENYMGETFTAQVMLVRNPALIYMGISSRVRFDKSIPGKRLDKVMEETGVAAAINGGKFFDDGSSSPSVGSVPIGMVWSRGACVWNEGENIPEYAGFVGFDEENILVVSKETLTQSQAEEMKIRDGCAMGPVLIVNGEINQDAYNEFNGYNPWTAIGQRADGVVIFVCINGRQVDSLGGGYADIIDIMAEYGAVNACNLEGGSSTTMLYRDTYGKLGEPGQVQLITDAPMQSAPRRMPDYWLVLP